MEKVLVGFVGFIGLSVIGLIPDFIVAWLVQIAGKWTGINYLADASYWQAFWLSVIVTTAISMTMTVQSLIADLREA